MPRCEICESENFKLIATEIREGAGKIIECSKCGLVMQDLGWNEKKFKKYYEKEYQFTNSLIRGKKLTAYAHFKERMKTIAPLFEQIKPFLSRDKKILEIGSGPGTLLSLCKPLVKKCVGVELNRQFVTFMKKELDIEAYDEDISSLKLNEQFDVIIMINTLDHLCNPLETLVTMKRILRTDGRIYIEVPNLNEALNFFLPKMQLSRYRRFFWHRAHLFYFTKETIAALFKKSGLAIRVMCRHEYSLKNYLNWYFLGKPQSSFVSATAKNELFDGHSEFEIKINQLFSLMEKEFKKILADTSCGDTLCCLGWVK